MKKIILSLALAFIGISGAFAAKAYTHPVNVTQQDGTVLTIYLHGDEHFNWVTTEDGALLIQVDNNYYIAETNTQGELMASKYLAHNPSSRTVNEAKAIKKQNKQSFLAYKAKQSAKVMGTGNSGVKYFPHTGSPKALVILVEFSDVHFQSGTKAKGVFEHFLNATNEAELPDGYEAYTGSTRKTLRNYGSVSQYFYDMSQGAFTPQFDVAGPYRLANPSLYYGAGSDNTAALVKDACTAAVNAGVDLAQYDADGDGNVDLVYIIYAGYAASMSGNSDDIWPKSGTGNFGTYHGKTVRRYGIHAELNLDRQTNQEIGYLISGIGLFCHEFSHTLGLPDLYPNKATSQVDNQSPEMWDLMDGGEYTLNGGYSPTPYSPWELQEMGWAMPTMLEDTPQTVTLPSFPADRTFYRINGDNGEYLLLQNIQQDGWWYYLSRLYNKGLLVWRIDRPNAETNVQDYPNNTLGKPGVTIVPADSYIISSYNKGDNLEWNDEQYEQSLKSDPFPATLKDSEGKDSLVNQLLSVQLNNSVLNKPLYNITQQENGDITFDYLQESTGIYHITYRQESADNRIYTLDGRYAGTDATNLPKGIYLINKKKVIVK